MSTIQVTKKNGVSGYKGNTNYDRLLAERYVEVSKMGSRFDLSFSSQLVLGNKIVALDGIRRCLLIMETGKEPYIINLNKVAAVTVKKSYGSISQGELKNKDLEEFLKAIDLQFEFTNTNETIGLTFYERETDGPANLPKLERNAKVWQMILSKLVGSQQARQSMEETG